MVDRKNVHVQHDPPHSFKASKIRKKKKILNAIANSLKNVLQYLFGYFYCMLSFVIILFSKFIYCLTSIKCIDGLGHRISKKINNIQHEIMLLLNVEEKKEKSRVLLKL